MSAAQGSLRAMVVDDSHFMRTVITDVLEEGGIAVVGEAGDGSQAVEQVAESRPDVVTMDHQMPEMSGLDAVERIMAEHPTPILMLSAYTAEGADVTFEALERGAVDFLAKPGGEVSAGMPRLKDQLVRKVRAAAQADVATPTDVADVSTSPADAITGSPTVVVASSTGGPRVVEQVLGALPATDLRVLVVQHMPDEFTGRFAARLDDKTDFRVQEATDGATAAAGEALVAPGGHHMVVGGYANGRVRVSLSDDPPVNGIRPAADVTMRSAAEVVDDRLVGTVLTGMGRDGAEGVRAITEAGGSVVAQDEETSVVFGMPGSAIETGCVDEVRPVDEVPAAIERAARGGPG